MNLPTKLKQSYRFKKQAYGYLRGKGERDKLEDWDWHIHTTIYKMGVPGGSDSKQYVCNAQDPGS